MTISASCQRDHGVSKVDDGRMDPAGASAGAQWQFCKDHPFGVTPDPYAGGLPSSFPSYCTVIK
jgi:hypothetical protein